jgi:hypothetical protein
MNSISNRHQSNLRFKLSKKKQYDFQLANSVLEPKDEYQLLMDLIPTNTGDKLENVIEWGGSSVGDLSGIKHFGLTGLDNGLIPFTGNYEDSINTLPTLNNKFTLNKVDGYSSDLNIDYSISVDEDNVINLQGGFYQGFYKLDGYDYQVLPNRHENGWTLSVDLMREPEISPSTSLNYYASQQGYDTKGFFFYTGTRAENKYWNQFVPDETYTGTTEASYEDIKVQTTSEEVIIPLPPPRIVIKRMDNQFLIYGRGSGRKVCTNNNTFTFGSHRASNIEKDEDGDVFITYSGRTTFDSMEDINSFLKYGRGSGKPVCGDESDHIDITVNGVDYDYGTHMARDDKNNDNLEKELNINEDLSDNALGFRITPTGEFSYRRFIKKDECLNPDLIIPGDTGKGPDDFVVIEESTEGLNLPELQWFNITIKWESDTPYECENDEPRIGKLSVYVDGYLVHVFESFTEIINKPLQEYKDKQLGVPYSISIGGGTQGLLENMTFGGTDPNDRGHFIERNFGGTFIGKLKNFKLYQESLSWCDIKNIITNNQ